MDFDASTKERKVQARDKDTGLPVWSVDVMDFDPDAGADLEGEVLRAGAAGSAGQVDLQAKDPATAAALAELLRLPRVSGPATLVNFHGRRPDLGCLVGVYAPVGRLRSLADGTVVARS